MEKWDQITALLREAPSPEEMKEMLLRIRFIQEDLGLVQRAKTRDIRSE